MALFVVQLRVVVKQLTAEESKTVGKQLVVVDVQRSEGFQVAGRCSEPFEAWCLKG